jgi:hypothetical protein
MDAQNQLAALGAGIMIIVMIFEFLFIALMIICQWIVFAKARQPGWAVLIPVYGLIIFLKLIGRPVSWIAWFLQLFVFLIFAAVFPGIITGLLFFLSAVSGLVFAIISTNDLSKSFGKGAGFTVGLIFLPFVFYPILAFGRAT